MFTSLFALLVLAPLSLASPFSLQRKEAIRQVAPGIELLQQVIASGEKDGPLVVTVLRIDPKVPGVSLRAALGGGTVWASDATLGREIPSKTVAKRKAVAGVNASFFPFAGNPIGLHVENGELVTEPSLPRGTFVLLDDGTPLVARFGFEGSVNGKPLHGLNRKPGKGNEILLFTPIFAEKTLKTEGRFEVVLESLSEPLRPGAKLTATVAATQEGGLTPLKPGTAVLSVGGELAEWARGWAKPGESVNLNLKVTVLGGGPELEPTQIAEAVTGAGWLVAEGKLALNLPAEKLQESFSTTRHPRTAVGITAEKKLLLVTVDGRQPTVSRGASLKELAAILLAQGAVEALNLDGGGSTALAFPESVANSPSEGVERAVADSLLVFGEFSQEAASGKLGELVGPTMPLKVGESFTFTLPDGARSERCVWATRGGIGFLSQEGVFLALRPGKGSVVLWHDGRSVRVPLTVVASKP